MKKKLIIAFMINAVYAEHDLTQSIGLSHGDNSTTSLSSTLLSSAEKIHPISSTKLIAGYSVSQTLDLAYAASLAYKDKKNQEVDIAAHGFTTIHSIRSEDDSLIVGDNSAFIGVRSDNSLVLSFAGTTSLRNLATDAWFNWAFDHNNGGCYHNGILVAFRSLQSQIMETFNQIAAERNITLQEVLAQTEIIGHSLGGGMALVAADILRRQGYEAQGVVTFAAPRVMDLPTAKEYNAMMQNKTLIVKQFTDPVPVISPFFLGSKQVGHQVVLPFVLDKWQHLLGGYIEVLDSLKQNNGSINVTRLTFGGLREKHATWYFERDESKDQFMPTVIKGMISVSLRALHRIALDTAEGSQAVYTQLPALNETMKWTASNTFSALKTTAQTIKTAALWSRDAYLDKERSTEQKVIDAIDNATPVVSKVAQSIVETSSHIMQKSVPYINSASKWLGSKIWQRTKDFVQDVTSLTR